VASTVTARLLVDRMINDELSPETVGEWIDELEANGLIAKYNMGDGEYLNLCDHFTTIRGDIEPDIRFPIPEFLVDAKAKEKFKQKCTGLADEIIDHINERTGSKYRHSVHSRKNTVARMYSDGYSYDDLKLVVDHKCAEWTTPKMAQYIRPQTLFGPNQFITYLTAAKIWRTKGSKDETAGYRGTHALEDYSKVVK